MCHKLDTAKGHMVGIAENIGHESTCKVITQDTEHIITQSELQPVSSGSDEHLDWLSGEDFNPNVPSCTFEFVKSHNEELSNSDSDQDKTPNSPMFSPTDLMDRAFPMNSDDFGHRYHAH